MDLTGLDNSDPTPPPPLAAVSSLEFECIGTAVNNGLPVSFSGEEADRETGETREEEEELRLKEEEEEGEVRGGGGGGGGESGGGGMGDERVSDEPEEADDALLE